MRRQDRSSPLGGWRVIVVRDTGAHPVKAGRLVRRAKRTAVAVAGVVAVLWVIAHLVQVLLVVGLTAYAARLARVWRWPVTIP